VFTYDKNSNLTSRTNRAGDTIYYEYDAMNRLTVKNRPGDPNITFLNDITGRIYDVNDAGDITEYYYDRLGRISDVNDPEERLVSYEYDDRGT
jgi:YD repeat-containing protein